MDGDYYRLLTDGSYKIQVLTPGYQTQSKYITVNNKPNENNAQRLDFILQPTSTKRIQRILKQLSNKVNHFVF